MKRKKQIKLLEQKLARAKRRKPVPAKPAAAAAPRKPMINDAVLARARRKRATATPVDIFKPAEPMPGVVPDGGSVIAQDSALVASGDWAQAQYIASPYQGIWQEGQAFLGYAYLAALAQRPEYRRISEVIATEMTRKWIKLQSIADNTGEDKSQKIKEISDELVRLRTRDVFREVAEQDGFFGRGHIYIDLGTTDDPQELKTPIGNGRNDVSVAKIKKGSLRRLKTVEAMWCYPSIYNATDPLSPEWYNPSMWYSMGKEIHSSRLLTFVGREMPDILKPAYSFGGLSMSQMAKPYVDNWLRTRQAVADLIHSFSVSGIKTDMQSAITGDGDQFFKRLDLFNLARDNNGAMALNKDTEEWFNVSTPLGTLDALQAQTQEHMAAVAGIPIVKLLGIQPAGLNASSQGEIETFDDNIHAYQEKLFREPLTRVIGFIQLSLYGAVDPAITFIFEPLQAMTPKERAEIRKLEAETDAVLINDAHALAPEESRKRIANDPDTPYDSLDVDDLPEQMDDGAGEELDDGAEPGEQPRLLPRVA